jgi:hypothetical protein
MAMPIMTDGNSGIVGDGECGGDGLGEEACLGFVTVEAENGTIRGLRSIAVPRIAVPVMAVPFA